jgi:hypothetical protein
MQALPSRWGCRRFQVDEFCRCYNCGWFCVWFCVCVAAPALAQETRYDLWGVVNHSGSLHGGHYTADCRNADTGEWHTFNDSRVSGTGTPSGGASPYVLFYLRRDMAPRSARL